MTVLPGDGIGPEVIEQAVRVLHAIGEPYQHAFQLDPALGGIAAIEGEGRAISDATMELCQRSDAVLFGAVGGISGYQGSKSQERPENALLRLRKELELFANLRPVRPFKALLNASTLKRECLGGTDLLAWREVRGGL